MDTLIRDIQECKNSLETLLSKINELALYENQTDWLTILNSMRIVSTDLISISKYIKDKRELMLKSCILVPKQFSEDIDPELKVFALTSPFKFFIFMLTFLTLDEKEITNNRISVFNQDVIPNVLRTKLIPQLEENEMRAYYAAKEFESVKTYDVMILSYLQSCLRYSNNVSIFYKSINQFKKAIEESANLGEKPKRDLDTSKSN